MSRFLFLHFGIIIMIFNGINCNMLYVPCPRCVMNFGIPNLDKGKNVNETMLFCEECIPNYKNSDHMSNFSKLNKQNSGKDSSCTDFYEYICGTWDEANSLFQTTWSNKDFTQYTTFFYIRFLLENKYDYDRNKYPIIKRAKQLYASCKNKDIREKTGLKPMQEMLDATGGWPILMSEEERNAKEFSWQKVDNDYLQLYSFSVLFNISYAIDEGFYPMFTIHPSLSRPLGNKLKIDVEHWSYDVYVNAIMKVVKAFAKDRGIRIPEMELLQSVTDLIIFEIGLQSIEYEKQDVKTKDKMTIAELQKIYNEGIQSKRAKINWLNKIRNISRFLDITVDNSETVLVYNKETLYELGRLLRNTRQHVIVNYLQWHVVRTFMSNLNDEMRNIELEYYKLYSTELYERLKQEQQWLTCIKEFQMKDALLYLYADQYASQDKLQAVTEIFNNLKNKMIEYINGKDPKELNSARKFIARKIDNTLLRIGHFEWYNDENVLNTIYDELGLDDNYFTNVLTIIKYRNIIKQRSVCDPKYRVITRNSHRSFDFLFGSPTYDPHINMIYIPIAMLHFPYFAYDKVNAVNYGGLGSIIGQQLAHNLNYHIGFYLDEYENLKYNAKIRQDYENQIECLLMTIDRHSFMLNTIDRTNYSEIDDLEYISIYEHYLKNESISHFIGIQIAFAAFKERKDLSGYTEKKFNFTQEQLFFHHVAQPICGTSNSYLKEVANINSAKEIINGNLANTKAFAEAFTCPKRSPMNPVLRCKISRY